MRGDQWLSLDGTNILARHGGFLLKIVHQHGSLLNTQRVVAISELVEGSVIKLGQFGVVSICVAILLRGGFVAAIATTLGLTLEWHATVFCVDGTVMAEEQIAPYECTSTFLTLERTLLSIYIQCQSAKFMLLTPPAHFATIARVLRALSCPAHHLY